MRLLSSKKSFALFWSIIVISFFSLIYYKIMLNINLSAKIDKMKFAYIQAIIYLDKAIDEIKNDKNISINDKNYQIVVDKDNKIVYIKSNKELIRLYKKY